MEPLPVSDLAYQRLKNLLEENGYQPSNSLEALFRSAGALSESLTPNRSLISSRLLLFAVARLHDKGVPEGNEAFDAGEWRAIRAAGALLQRDPDDFEARRTEYFSSRERLPPEEPDLSRNVWQVLRDLMARKTPASDQPPIITASDFLLAFPPVNGQARDLLSKLRIEPAEFHKAIETALPEPGNDRVGTHRDEPARADELGRLAFAQVLGDRIREAHEGRNLEDESAFVVHIHGPWGSGKSSVLNFLEDDLRGDRFQWIVVTFNAWRDQRLQPPWWSLITSIYAGARSTLDEEKDDFGRARLKMQWFLWRLRADFLPIAAVIACLVLTIALLAFGFVTSASAPLTLLTGAIGVVGAVYIGGRSLALGSQRAAQAYADLKNDPYKPITKLFKALMGAMPMIDRTPRPVAVFIDDLDRCDGKYVVELLEGIQTLMRGSALTYVIAADRKWICSSFEQRYQGFTPPIGEPGRPLGYLFLDKIFQISVAIPQLASDRQSAYWQRLLSDKRPGADEGKDGVKKDIVKKDPVEAQKDAHAEAGRYTTHDELQAYVKRVEAGGDAVEIEAARAAAARQITSTQAALKTQHQLEKFARLIEPNPRAMKRLVNAYGMHQAALFLEGRATKRAPLARWTIIELRWPLLADFLVVRPQCVDGIRDRLSAADMPEVPEALRALFGDEFVVRVVGDANGDGLTSAALKSILGTSQDERERGNDRRPPSG